MPPLSNDTINILKTTAPVVKTEGTKITTRMYEIMFNNYPNIKNLFNATHFVRAEETNSVAPQAQALANAVLAYASNIDNLGALGGAVAKMAHKHVSFDVQPEHYAIVGECLLQALKDVLGDAATEDVMTGWKEAYEFLADLLIGIEGGMKTQNSEKKGGWSGFTPLVVFEKVQETDDVYSFHLKKPDGSDLPDFKPGQYLSFRIPKGEIVGFDFDIVRNYSISNKPGESFMRISVKREMGSGGSPAGAASSYLHDKINVGSLIEVGMPCGTFVLKEDNDRPIVLIAGGIGVTPMVSMVDYIKGKENESRVVTFIECAKSEAKNPMRNYIDSITNGTTLISHAFYTGGELAESFQNTKIQYGRVEKNALAEVVPSPADGNEYYVCGPPSFLENIIGLLTEMGVPPGQINHEYFGPALL